MQHTVVMSAHRRQVAEYGLWLEQQSSAIVTLARYLPKQTPRHFQGRKRKDGQHGMCTADFTTLERLPQHWKSPKVQTPTCDRARASLIRKKHILDIKFKKEP